MDMIIVWALSWWYGAGWKLQLARLRERMDAIFDYFSIGLLLKTLFAPFRQISAGKVNGPLDMKVRAFIDRSISRLIGGFVRTVLVIVGIAWIIVSAVVGIAWIVLWAFLPFAPFIGFIAMLSGWVPTWT